MLTSLHWRALRLCGIKEENLAWTRVGNGLLMKLEKVDVGDRVKSMAEEAGVLRARDQKRLIQGW